MIKLAFAAGVICLIISATVMGFAQFILTFMAGLILYIASFLFTVHTLEEIAKTKKIKSKSYTIRRKRNG